LYSFAALRPELMKQQLKDHFGNPFTVYPNPTKQLLNIDIHSDKDRVQKISVLNHLGQTVFEHNGSWNNPISLPYLQTGVYILQIRFDDRIYNEQLMLN